MRITQSRRPIPVFRVMLVLASAGVVLQAATRDSADFPYQQNGDLSPNPHFTTSGMTDAGGGILNFTGLSLITSSAWTALESNVISNGFTIEARVKVTANGDYGFGIMPTARPQLAWCGIKTDNTFTQYSPGQVYWGGGPNNDDFHVFRIAHAPGAPTLSLWKDGVLLTDTAGLYSTWTGGAFLNIGNISLSGGSGQLDYVRWTAGAYEPAPAPLPGTLLVVGGAGAGLLVEAGGYLAISTSAANLGGGTTERHFLNHYRTSLIRQDGIVERVGLYLAAKPAAVGAFYFEVWRKSGATWDRVSQEDLWPRMTGGQINDLALSAPPLAQEGDYVGYGYTCTADPGLFLTAATDPDLYDPGGLYSNKSYSVTDAACATNSYDWAARTPSPLFVPIKVYMQPPKLAFTGDSIISGSPNHLSFIDNYFPEAYGRPPIGIHPETTIGYKAGKALNWSYQNLGVAGASTDWLVNHGVFNYLVQIKPEIVVMNVGINDLAVSVSKATFLANYTTMLEACRVNSFGIVINLIMPRTDFTNTKAREMDDWNVSLQALAAVYGATVVDARPLVGQFRAGGDPGNYWDLRPEYAADIVHLKPEGHAVVAQAIVEALGF